MCNFLPMNKNHLRDEDEGKTRKTSKEIRSFGKIKKDCIITERTLCEKRVWEVVAMRNIIDSNSLELNEQQRQALFNVKQNLKDKYPISELIVFGSVARHTASFESDLDLLVITDRLMSHRERAEMSDVVFEVNLEYDTNISLVVIDGASWNGGIYSLTQFYAEVARDGVYV